MRLTYNYPFMTNITVRVGKPWQGKVAIRDKYVKKATDEKKGIVIHVGDEHMTLPPEKVAHPLFVSKEPIPDKFSKEMHHLVYYAWQPDKKEATMPLL